MDRTQAHGQNPTIVVMGGNLEERPFIAEVAASLGMRAIAALDSALGEQQFPAASWHRILRWSANKTREDCERAARSLADALRDEHVDGVVAFADYTAPLAGLLAELLGVARVSAETLWTCRTKLGQYSLLSRAGSPYPPRVRVIGTGSTAAEAAAAVGLPAILRISHSCGAVGVRLVSDVAEIVPEAERLSAVPSAPQNSLVSTFESEILLVEYLRGSEHDVDVVLVDGKPRFAFVTDNGPTDLPFFRETSHIFPSRLPTPAQERLKAAAVSCLCDLGLKNGVYNVEMRLTPGGPRLIEINLRMGGFYIYDFTKHVFGYDLCAASLSIACGLEPPAKTEPTGYLAGFSVFPSDPVDLSAVPPGALHVECGDQGITEYEQPSHFISFPGKTSEEAAMRATAAAPRIVGPERGAKLGGYFRALLQNGPQAPATERP